MGQILVETLFTNGKCTSDETKMHIVLFASNKKLLPYHLLMICSNILCLSLNSCFIDLFSQKQGKLNLGGSWLTHFKFVFYSARVKLDYPENIESVFFFLNKSKNGDFCQQTI